MSAALKLKAPYPYFGGKRTIADVVWSRLGSPKQYIEPFCGSAAVLWAAPQPASLEVIGDQNFYVANFWRAVKFQPDEVAKEQDYPVSHVDLDARHHWLTQPERTAALREALADPEWIGDARIAGWWVWGQCAWIGSGWCERDRTSPMQARASSLGKVPHSGNAGRVVQAVTLGKIPHVTDAGKGVQSQIPHVTDAGMGVAAWFRRLATRLERVRVIHGDWSRCLNHHYGANSTAIFFDPPYRKFEALYSKAAAVPVADAVCDWARQNSELRIALCGHRGDYDLPGWDVHEWSRGRLTYGGSDTTEEEAIWFSPGCVPAQAKQRGLFE